MKKSLFRRFVCLMAVMLMAVSMVSPAVAYSDDISPRSPTCPRCQELMGRHTIESDVTRPCGKGGTHAAILHETYYYCSSCNFYGSLISSRYSTSCSCGLK